MVKTDEKKTLRRDVKRSLEAQTALQMEKEDKDIARQLETDIDFAKAETVLMYWSVGREVDTHGFIEKWSGEKRILLPVVAGDELELRLYEGLDRMKSGAFNILEPQGADFDNYGSIDVVVVPGLAFDGGGNRLGRGKGYYDRLLCKLSAVKIGVCRACQFVPAVPVELRDQKMDKVLHAVRD